METLTLAGAILGGLGLFVLAIEMMTDGLTHAAGASLRNLLSKWCSTPLKGVFTGFMMTAIVQSSSAVTVASLGFVNAGLINMRQTLGIIYGSNVGTTMTGWLVALIGFNLNIQVFALPMIGLGMALKIIKKNGQAASFGMALVGFGLFFVGLDVLKNAFDGIVNTFDMTSFTAEGLSGILVFLLFGVVMTVLTQSSSASIALTITAASSQMIGIYAAGAMVIGANIGTTSTAIMASIGATSPAKRVAAAQVIFNLVTASVALLIMPILFFIINWLSNAFALAVNPAISLAMFHTIFNILGVLLVFPLNDKLASFLDTKFLSWEEKESHPKYIDKNVAQTPALAVNALVLELRAISEKITSSYDNATQPSTFKLTDFQNQIKVIKSLSSQVSDFIVKIQGPALDSKITSNLTTLMRIEQYFLSCTYCVQRIAESLIIREKFNIDALEYDTVQFFESILEFMKASRLNQFDSVTSYNEQYEKVQAAHDKLKANLLSEGTLAHISVVQMSGTIDCLAEALQLTELWFKALTRLQSIHVELESFDNENHDIVVDGKI
ncbi:Na/Pi cotransporter family protein [Thalassotalea piscium]